MRRFIAYLVLSFAILFSVAVSFEPVFTRMSASRAYRSSYEVVYQIDDPDATDDEDVTGVAEEMERRLKEYGVGDYSVKVEGLDTIRVNFPADSPAVYENIRDYLPFSGGDFSIADNNAEGGDNIRLTQDEVFKDVKASIKYEGLAPFVIIPVSDPAKMDTLVEDAKSSAAGGGEEGEEAKADIFLWANWAEDDDYAKAERDPDHTGKKIICAFNSSHIWYEKSKVEKTELVYVAGFSDASGKYDASKISEANDQAVRIRNLFNASKYDIPIKTLFYTNLDEASDVNNPAVPAGVESLVLLGSNKTLAFSATLISILIGGVIVSLLLILFFRLAAIGVIVNSIGTIFLTFLVSVFLGTTFNVALLAGGLLVALASLALGIFHLSKFKEEVYKGRSYKKANQEAAKRLNLPTIDVAVIMAFAGLMVYLIAGDFMKPFGVMLFFGAIFILAMNLIVLKILAWLLTNTTTLQGKAKTFNIEASRVPSLSDVEEKPVYEGPYAKTDFTKRRKLIGGIAGALAGVGAVMMLVFGIINGNVLNTKALNAEKTVAYVRLTTDTPASLALTGEAAFRDEVLAHVAHVEDPAAEEKVYDPVSFEGVEFAKSKDKDYLSTVVTYDYYFITTFDDTYTDEDSGFARVEEVTAEDGTTSLVPLEEGLTLQDALSRIVGDLEGRTEDEFLSVSVKSAREIAAGPNLGFIALASVLSLLGGAIYLAFRFRISRGLGVFVIGTLTSFLTLSFFAITRIAAGNVLGLVLPFAAVFALIAPLFYLVREKEIIREEKPNALTGERRRELMVKATGLGAAPFFILVIVGAYLAINFFGFGPSAYALLFSGFLIAVALSALLVPSLVGPLAFALEALKPKFRLKPRKPKPRKTRIKLRDKPKTTEPEETVFIGIND